MVKRMKNRTLLFKKSLKRAKLADVVAKNIFLFFAVISIFTTIGIILSLVINSSGFFSKVSIWKFLTGTEWTPLFSDPEFGILPLVAGTFIITAGAALIAMPVGLCTAIFLSEFAKPGLRKVIKPFLEILAGIPSIVYGYFALTYITPLLQKVFPSTEIYNAASAFIAVGIMTIPLVSSLSEDALRAVPDSLRNGAYAMGATKTEVSLKVVIPAAISGITASFVLAVSRAIGETMIVTVAAGARPNLTLNPLESIQTMTAFIVQISQGDNPHGTVGFYALYAVGLLLFLLTLGMNIISHYIVEKRWEVY
ncbi:MAG: phosphate ABC transporter permease subunit PstC [Clostridiales bacterium]|nr:phosphate ABC transporter permease subunit PstC [Clostridiales bacterium]